MFWSFGSLWGFFNPKTMKSLVLQSLSCFLSTKFVLLSDHPLAIIVVQENKRLEGFNPLHPKSRSFENMIDIGNGPSTKGGSCFSSCPTLKDHIRLVHLLDCPVQWCILAATNYLPSKQPKLVCILAATNYLLSKQPKIVCILAATNSLHISSNK